MLNCYIKTITKGLNNRLRKVNESLSSGVTQDYGQKKLWFGCDLRVKVLC